MDNWSQLQSRQQGGQFIQVHTQRQETASNIGDMLKTIFHTQKKAFKINMSFGFILSKVKTGEKRFTILTMLY